MSYVSAHVLPCEETRRPRRGSLHQVVVHRTHTTLLLLSLSVWCCCSSPVPHLAASLPHRMLVDVFNLLSFMINSCVTIIRSYIKGLWEMLLSHYIVCCVCGGTVISVGAVCGRCLRLNWLLPESVGELQKNNDPGVIILGGEECEGHVRRTFY